MKRDGWKTKSRWDRCGWTLTGSCRSKQESYLMDQLALKEFNWFKRGLTGLMKVSWSKAASEEEETQLSINHTYESHVWRRRWRQRRKWDQNVSDPQQPQRTRHQTALSLYLHFFPKLTFVFPKTNFSFACWFVVFKLFCFITLQLPAGLSGPGSGSGLVQDSLVVDWFWFRTP